MKSSEKYIDVILFIDKWIIEKLQIYFVYKEKLLNFDNTIQGQWYSFEVVVCGTTEKSAELVPNYYSHPDAIRHVKTIFLLFHVGDFNKS